MLLKIGILECGRAKRSPELFPVAAEVLYTGRNFGWGKQYVQATCDQWGILSAKYGLLMPSDLVKPYELAVKVARDRGAKQDEMTKAERAAWYEKVNAQLKGKFPTDAQFIALVSSAYEPALKGLNAVFPLHGLGLFQRVSKLKQLANQNQK